MNNRSPVQVAVVGCGAWGKNLVRNFHQLGALATVVERNPDVIAGIRSEYGVECRDLEDVLADPGIQGVVVALAARHHHEIAKRVLEAGKHLYVEKPLTLSYGEALELVNLAGAKGSQLMVGHLPRYHPAYTKLVELVNQGEIGELRYVSSHRLSLGRIRGDETCLWDLGPHDLSMILALTGEPVETFCQTSCIFEEGLVDSAMVHMTFAHGVKGHLYNSWMHPFKEHRFMVIGTKGMLVFDDTKDWDQKLMVYHHVIEKQDQLAYHTEMLPGQPVALTQGEPLKIECQHFLDCILEDRVPLTGPEDALRVMKVLELIHEGELPAATSLAVTGA